MAALRLKRGVNPSGARTEVLLAIMIAHQVYQSHNESLTITSISDGRHMPGSLHYVGLAVDFRLPSKKAEEISSQIQRALGKRYDVVLESTHIHVEYQPK